MATIERFFVTEQEAAVFVALNGTGSVSICADRNPPWRAIVEVPDPEPVALPPAEVEIKPKAEPKSKRRSLSDMPGIDE